jgi:hypothetical protein
MQSPELLVIVAVVIAPVDSPKGSISPSTFVPRKRFAALSLWCMALPVVACGDTLGHINKHLYSSTQFLEFSIDQLVWALPELKSIARRQ